MYQFFLVPLLTAAFASTAGSELSFSSRCNGFSASLEFPPPRYALYDGRWYPSVGTVPAFGDAGELVLPAYRLVVPIPPGADPELEHRVGEATVLDGPPGPPLIAPYLKGRGLSTTEVYPPRPAGRAVRPVEMSVQRLAGSRVAVLTVRPVFGEEARLFARRVDVELTWPDRPGGRSLGDGPLRLVCPPGVLGWRSESPTDAGSEFWGRPWARIETEETGMAVVTGRELEEAGCGLTGTPTRTLRLYSGPGLQFDLGQPSQEHDLQEVAMEVVDGGDGLFDASDSVFFFSRAPDRFIIPGEAGSHAQPDTALLRSHHRYSGRNVYWLTWGGESGLRMERVNASPGGAQPWGDELPHHEWLEQELLWEHREPVTGWVWSPLLESLPLTVYLPGQDPTGPGWADLAVQVNAGPVDLTVLLNQDTVYTGTLASGKTRAHLEDLRLIDGNNRMDIAASGGDFEAYLDYVYCCYPRRLVDCSGRMLFFLNQPEGRFDFQLGCGDSTVRLYDVSCPDSVRRLTGIRQESSQVSFAYPVTTETVLVVAQRESLIHPVSLSSAQPGRIKGMLDACEVVVIAAEELADVAVLLESVYSARGKSCEVVTDREVYDEFGQGVRDPGAIRSFVRFTQDAWSDPAEALVLVGDGHHDPRGHGQSSVPSLIPAWIAIGGASEICRDDYYVVAHEGQELPEIPVSRISVDDRGELSGYLAKLMDYGAAGSMGTWAGWDLFVADDEWGDGYNEREHTLTCEYLADTVLSDLTDRHKFYLVEYPWPEGTTPGGPHPEKPEAREDLVERLATGCRSMTFMGHGSYDQLAAERLLVSGDAERLGNRPRLPVMLLGTCDTGLFSLVSADCFAEEFQSEPGGGAIAVVASTGASFGFQNRRLFADLLSALYNESQPATLAEALWSSKVEDRDMRYVLFGDGGLHAPSPAPALTELVVSGDTLLRGRMATATATFEDEGTCFLRVTESADTATYTCLGGAALRYLRYGEDLYSGRGPGEGPVHRVDFFVPMQADTGSMSRCGAFNLSPGSIEMSSLEWVPLVDIGGHAEDDEPPEIELWLDGWRGEEEPRAHGDVALRGMLRDSSGICCMGGGAGRSIMMDLDSQGYDVSAYFAYRPGSYTTGDLEVDLPGLALGPHTLVLAAWDGMGNCARDTLRFEKVDAAGESIAEVVVYPNPGEGLRCFSFRASSQGSVGVAVYTVAGRTVWRSSVQCEPGYNQILWDGSDLDGDPLASGTYVYRISYLGGDGARASHVGRVVVIND